MRISWLTIVVASAALSLQPPEAGAGEHWFVIPYLDGAIGFDAESIEVDARDRITVTVGGYSRQPIDAIRGIPVHYFLQAAQFDCAGKFNIRSNALLDNAGRRVQDEPELEADWQSVSSSLYVAIDAAMCANRPLQSAREAFNLPDALTLMKSVVR